MLNIPECVKALYKTDGRTNVRKNFRVTFPYSSRADITNDQIVTESVRFTESIMSQNTFRFGLAEAPQISFETVGVANMMGMTIRCWSEIETTSLTAAEVETIEAGEWDGEYIALEDSDIGYAFFRLLLGEFVVDSCPRSHGAMTRRQVKATGRAINNSNMDAFTKWKLAQQYTSKTWNIDWNFLAPSVYGDTWENAGKYFDSSGDYYDMTLSTGAKTVKILFPGQQGYGIYEIITPDSDKPQIKNKCLWYNSQNKLIRISRSGYHNFKTAFRANVAAAFSQLNAQVSRFVDWTVSTTEEQTPLGSMDACIDYVADTLAQNEDFAAKVLIGLDNYGFDENANIYTVPYNGGASISDLDAILSTDAPDNVKVEVLLPHGVTAFRLIARYGETITYSATCSETTEPEGAATAINLLTLKSEYAVDFPTLPLPTTLETKQSGVKYYGYVNSFSFKKLLMSFFETQGQFGRFKRDGSVEVYTLTTAPAEELTQSDLAELWWDESDVEPVGSVRVKFKTGNDEESTANISIGDGESVYDMTDNYMLTKWEFTLDEVTDIIQGKFAERAAVLTWTPTDATIRGLPYLEAGDWLTCDTGAEDITEVGFPMLDRQMSGIQSLSDDISAVSGEVTAVEVDEDE